MKTLTRFDLDNILGVEYNLVADEPILVQNEDEVILRVKKNQTNQVCIVHISLKSTMGKEYNNDCEFSKVIRYQSTPLVLYSVEYKMMNVHLRIWHETKIVHVLEREYTDGIPLSNYIKKYHSDTDRLPYEDFISVSKQLVDNMYTLNDIAGVLHLNVNPDTLYYDSESKIIKISHLNYMIKVHQDITQTNVSTPVSPNRKTSRNTLQLPDTSSFETMGNLLPHEDPNNENIQMNLNHPSVVTKEIEDNRKKRLQERLEGNLYLPSRDTIPTVKTDIYAIGATLFRLLFGLNAFHQFFSMTSNQGQPLTAEERMALLMNQFKGKNSILKDTPKSLIQCILLMIHPDPEERPSLLEIRKTIHSLNNLFQCMNLLLKNYSIPRKQVLVGPNGEEYQESVIKNREFIFGGMTTLDKVLAERDKQISGKKIVDKAPLMKESMSSASLSREQEYKKKIMRYYKELAEYEEQLRGLEEENLKYKMNSQFGVAPSSPLDISILPEQDRDMVQLKRVLKYTNEEMREKVLEIIRNVYAHYERSKRLLVLKNNEIEIMEASLELSDRPLFEQVKELREENEQLKNQIMENEHKLIFAQTDQESKLKKSMEVNTMEISKVKKNLTEKYERELRVQKDDYEKLIYNLKRDHEINMQKSALSVRHSDERTNMEMSSLKDNLNSIKSSHQQEIEKIQQENREKLESMMKDAQEQISEYRRQINGLNSRLETYNNQKNINNSTATHSIQQLQAINTHLEQEIEEKDEQILKLEELAEEANSASMKSELKVRILTSDHRNMITEMEKYKETVRVKDIEIVELKTQISSLEENHKLISTQLDTSQQDLAVIRANSDEQSMSKLKQDLIQRNNMLLETRNRMHDCEYKIKELESQVVTLEIAGRSSRSSLKQAEQKLLMKDAQLAKYEQSRESWQMEAETLIQKQYTSRIRQLEMNNRDCKKQVQLLQSTLENEKRMNERLKEAHDAEIKKHVTTEEELRTQLSNQSSDNESSLVKSNAQYESMIEDLKKKYEVLLNQSQQESSQEKESVNINLTSIIKEMAEKHEYELKSEQEHANIQLLALKKQYEDEIARLKNNEDALSIPSTPSILEMNEIANEQTPPPSPHFVGSPSALAEHLKQKNKDLKEELDHVKGLVINASVKLKKYTTLKLRLATILSKNEKLTLEVDQKNAEIDQLRCDMRDMNEDYKLIKGDEDEIRENKLKNELMKRENMESLEKLSLEKEKNTTLIEKEATLNNKIHHLEEQVGKLREENEKLHAYQESTMESKGVTEHEFSKLKADFSEARKKLQTHHEHIHKRDEIIKQQEQCIETMQKHEKQLDKQINQITSENDSLKTTCENQDKKLVSQQQYIVTLEKDNDRKDSTIRRLNTEKELVESTLKDEYELKMENIKAAHAAEHKDKMDVQHSEMNDLRATISMLEDEKEKKKLEYEERLAKQKEQLLGIEGEWQSNTDDAYNNYNDDQDVVDLRAHFNFCKLMREQSRVLLEESFFDMYEMKRKEHEEVISAFEKDTSQLLNQENGFSSKSLNNNVDEEEGEIETVPDTIDEDKLTYDGIEVHFKEVFDYLDSKLDHVQDDLKKQQNDLVSANSDEELPEEIQDQLEEELNVIRKSQESELATLLSTQSEALESKMEQFKESTPTAAIQSKQNYENDLTKIQEKYVEKRKAAESDLNIRLENIHTSFEAKRLDIENEFESLRQEMISEHESSITESKPVVEKIVETSGKLTVIIDSCTDLGGSHSGDTQKPDPFVVISLNNLKHETQVLKTTTDPIFKETFEFNVSDCNREVIEIQVRNKANDVLIGSCEVELDKLVKNVIKGQIEQLFYDETKVGAIQLYLNPEFGIDPNADTKEEEEVDIGDKLKQLTQNESKQLSALDDEKLEAIEKEHALQEEKLNSLDVDEQTAKDESKTIYDKECQKIEEEQNRKIEQIKKTHQRIVDSLKTKHASILNEARKSISVRLSTISNMKKNNVLQHQFQQIDHMYNLLKKVYNHDRERLLVKKSRLISSLEHHKLEAKKAHRELLLSKERVNVLLAKQKNHLETIQKESDLYEKITKLHDEEKRKLEETIETQSKEIDELKAKIEEQQQVIERFKIALVESDNYETIKAYRKKIKYLQKQNRVFQNAIEMFPSPLMSNKGDNVQFDQAILDGYASSPKNPTPMKVVISPKQPFIGSNPTSNTVSPVFSPNRTSVTVSPVLSEKMVTSPNDSPSPLESPKANLVIDDLVSNKKVTPLNSPKNTDKSNNSPPFQKVSPPPVVKEEESIKEPSPRFSPPQKVPSEPAATVDSNTTPVKNDFSIDHMPPNLTSDHFDDRELDEIPDTYTPSGPISPQSKPSRRRSLFGIFNRSKKVHPTFEASPPPYPPLPTEPHS